MPSSKKKKRASPPPPYVISTLLCDVAYRDSVSGKCSFLGAFTAIAGRQFPLTHRAMFFHVELTDGRGKTNIKLQLIDADEKTDPLFATETMVEFNDPRMVAELDFALQNVVFPEPGEYRFQVFGNDELLMERRLLVVKAEQQGE